VITDTHIDGPDDLAGLRRFLCSIQDRQVDFLLILGDICGHAPEYLPQVREVIEHSGLRVHVISGNHDDNYGKNPEWFGEAFQPSYYSFDHKGWRFVMHNSQNPAPPEWLRKQLAGDRPIVFCQHYPPMPKQTIEDMPWQELTRQPNVKLAMVGHAHRRMSGRIGTVSYEVLGNCFFTGQAEEANYYLIDALADGGTRLREFSLAGLKMREPTDKVPTVALRKPHSGEILRNSTTLAGSAGDDKALERVECSVDFGPWERAEGTASWQFRLDTAKLPDGHHFIRARAVDSAGQPSIELATLLALVENHPPQDKRIYRLQQGIDAYEGCRDVTVRRHEASKSPGGEEGQLEDLECWTWKDGEVEFSEFYIRFDLAKAGIPKDATIKRVTLTLYGSRQNQIDDQGQLCRYYVGVMAEPWQPDMTFATRPSKPGWLCPAELPAEATLALCWPYLGGRQLPVPPQPMHIDLTPIRQAIQEWLSKPLSNHGLVFSPASGRGYNLSAKGSRCNLATLRPRLEIELAGAGQ
jgi:calcineurin-like phosphoesterase family protein